MRFPVGNEKFWEISTNQNFLRGLKTEISRLVNVEHDFRAAAKGLKEAKKNGFLPPNLELVPVNAPRYDLVETETESKG